MSTLSDRQISELNKSILDYLKVNGYNDTFDTFKKEANEPEYAPEPKKAGLLEKKWTSVIRLQKKVMDLENRNAQLVEELSTSRTLPASSKSSLDWIPRNPSKHSLTGHRSPVTRITFHPLFSSLVSASEDFTIKIWDWETGEFERTLKGHTKSVMDVDYDSKGNMLVSCSSDLTLKLWDSNNDYKNVKTLYGHDHSVSSCRFMPGDDLVVSASRDQSIRIWEVARGFCVKTLSGHSDWVRLAVPSYDGQWLLSCSSDQTARLWNATSGDAKMDFRGHDHVIEVVAFAPLAAHSALRELSGIDKSAKDVKEKESCDYIATGSRDKTIKIWNGMSGQCIKTLEGHDNWVRALVFHPSGKYLLSASDDKTIRVWDLVSGRCAKTVDAHAHFITCMAWGRQQINAPSTTTDNSASADATNGTSSKPNEKEQSGPRLINVLATGSVDQSVKVWLP